MLYRFSKHLRLLNGNGCLLSAKGRGIHYTTISILEKLSVPFIDVGVWGVPTTTRRIWTPVQEVLLGLQEMHRTKDEQNKQLIEALKADAELLMRKYNGKLHEIEVWVDGCRARWQLVLSQSDAPYFLFRSGT